MLSKRGLELIKKFEGLGDGNPKTSILEPYQDQVGVWTIGYGNTYLLDGTRVTKSTKAITQAEAEAMLLKSLATVYEPQVRKDITVQLTQNQYDACVSFCFNLGSMREVGKAINNGTITRDIWLKYVYAKGKKLPVLVARRNKEADLFYEI